MRRGFVQTMTAIIVYRIIAVTVIGRHAVAHAQAFYRHRLKRLLHHHGLARVHMRRVIRIIRRPLMVMRWARMRTGRRARSVGIGSIRFVRLLAGLRR